MKIEDDTLKKWSKYARVYDPIKCASIDGTDCEPHDRAVIRALNSTYKPNRFVKGRPECTIFVSRLNHETSKDTIKDIFSKYGKLKRFRMVKDIVTGMPKGYAFVEYEEEEAAEEAYRVTNKMVVDGNAIFVDFECERLLEGWKPRRLGGGIAGKKESGQLRFGGRDRPFKKPIALELKEKEERKLRERRAREEDRRRRDKSRDRIRKKSPLRENGIDSPSLSRKKFESTKEDKRPPSPIVKKDSGSPPRKISRRHSPPKVNGNPSRRSPHREKRNDRVLTREKARPNSPPRKKDNRTSPLRQNGKQYSCQEKHVKPKSPVHEHLKLKSPTSENTRKKSPFRKLIRGSSKDVAPGKSESCSPSQRAHYPSPSKQNSRDQSPPERHSKHSPPRDRIRRRSPILSKVKYSPERGTDKKRPPLSRREKNRSRSPPQSNTKYTASSRDGDRYIRHDSPVRKPRLPFAGREDDIRRSPLGSPVPNFAPARARQSSPKRSPLNRPYSPRHGKDSREYRLPRTEHRSPGRRTPPRDIKREYSPPKQDISRRHLGGDSIGYHESLKGSSYQQMRGPRGDSHSPIFKRERRSASAEYFPREHRVQSPRHEHGRQSPYKDYSQPPPLSGDSHIPYHYENQYGHSYSENGPNGREFPPTKAEFRQHSPPRVDFRQPPPSFEQPRQYSSFQDNTHFPPPTRDYPPPRTDEPFRDSHPARDFPQRGAHPHRDGYPSKETTGEFCPSEQTEYFSHPHQDEKKHFPLARDEGRHHESRHFEEFPYHHSNFPPMRGGRKFPSSRENADAFDFGRGRGHRFSRQRGGPRGGRRGFRPY